MLRSSQLLPALLLTFAINCCKKAKPDDYFFKCDIDGKSINLPVRYNQSGQTVFFGKIDQNILIDGTNINCAASGQYCFETSITVAAQQTGTFAADFDLRFLKEPRMYAYSSYPDLHWGDVQVKISHIIRGTLDDPGVLSGTFTGTALKYVSSEIAVGDNPVQLHGSFAVPLIN